MKLVSRLDPPLSRIDIENGTVFQARDGSLAIITMETQAKQLPFYARYILTDGTESASWLTRHGNWVASDCHTNPRDLIARLSGVKLIEI